MRSFGISRQISICTNTKRIAIDEYERERERKKGDIFIEQKEKLITIIITQFHCRYFFPVRALKFIYKCILCGKKTINRIRE